MVDTLANVSLPERTWVNLYAATSIPVGVQLRVQNLTSNEVLLNEGAAQPTALSAYNVLDRYVSAVNDAGATGAWAYCHSGGKLNVRRA